MSDDSRGVRAVLDGLRYASEFTTSGYSVAALRCVRALLAEGVPLRWQPLVTEHGSRVPTHSLTDVPADLARTYRPPRPGELAVVHSVPQGWARTRHELAPTRMVGHTVWEADSFPSLWLDQMSPADEFWVPTEWNRYLFEEAFRRPVHVVPHAVSEVTPVQPPVHELPSDRTVFVSVAAWDWRKRPDRAIEAYVRAFDESDPVLLVVKTTRMPVAWPERQHLPTVAHIHALLDRLGRRPSIVLDTADWTEAEMLGLYREADCFLSMTSSEGWGLGAFDAAALGTPVVIGGYGGHVEWLGHDYPGLLPFRMVDAVHPDAALFERGLRWAEPDMEAAVHLLRAIASGGAEELRQRAQALREELQVRYSARAVASAALEALPDELRVRGG